MSIYEEFDNQKSFEAWKAAWNKYVADNPDLYEISMKEFSKYMFQFGRASVKLPSEEEFFEWAWDKGSRNYSTNQLKEIYGCLKSRIEGEK